MSLMPSQELAQGVAANTISLMLGHPDPATLFTPEFQEAVMRVLASPQPYQSLQYGPEQGTPALVEYLVAKIKREQAISPGIDQLLLTSGSTQAVDMIARLLIKPGDPVIVEAPSYVDALHVLRDHGAELYSIPIDERGLIPETLKSLLEQLNDQGNLPRLLYTIPNFHNPTGVSLSEERRIKILQLARQYHFVVVEDDVYRDLTFEGTVPQSFFALAEGDEVLSIGSFSKTLAPGLRLGWLAGSKDAIRHFVQCGVIEMGGGANPFAAQIVAEYCNLGHWEEHIQYLQRLYRSRRDVMLAALDQYMPEGVTWTRPAGGFFIWVSLPQNIPAQTIKKLALERDVLCSGWSAQSPANLQLCTARSDQVRNSSPGRHYPKPCARRIKTCDSLACTV
jgi:2-aminoadipate transaminase